MRYTYPTCRVEQITRPDELGIVRASLSSAIKMLVALACHLYLILPPLIHAYRIGLQHVSIKGYLVMFALNLVVASVVAGTLYGVRISGGKIKTLFRAMK